MRAVWLDKSIPRVLTTLALRKVWAGAIFAPTSPVKLGETDAALPADEFVRVSNRLAGVCGSDLHLVHVDLDPMIHGAALPGYDRIYLGHEVVGVIDEVGPAVTSLAPGDRVCLRNHASCLSQGIEPACRHCVEGNYGLCENQSAHQGPEGVGGGWSDAMVCHHSQLWKVPDDLTDEQAMLLEPIACGVRGVMRRPPASGDRVLVIGCGIIGLGLIQALRIVAPEATVFASARHPHQQEAARRFGAEVLEGDLYKRAAELTGAKLYEGEFGNRTLLGGFDVVYDCVGNDRTVHDALRMLRAQGALVLVGVNLHRMRVDLTPTWHQEIDVVGTLAHGMETHLGERISTFDLAARWMQSGALDVEGLVTHRFPLERWKDAVRTATDKRSGAIKVAFELGGTQTSSK